MKAILRPLLLFILVSPLIMPLRAMADENDSIVLTVVENDCLTNICRRYLEDPRKWPEIGRINHLKDYNLIRSGSRLVIPIRLLRGVPADGLVLFLKGDVELKDRKGGPWKRLRQNDPVRQGNLIRTGKDGAVEIAFADGTGFFLKPDTTLDLQTSQVKGGSHLLQRFFLATGRILTKVRNATGRESRIEIPTPSATAVVRGTDFRVSIVSDDASTCEVMEGEGTRVKKGEPPLKPRKLSRGSKSRTPPVTRFKPARTGNFAKPGRPGGCQGYDEIKSLPSVDRKGKRKGIVHIDQKARTGSGLGTPLISRKQPPQPSISF